MAREVTWQDLKEVNKELAILNYLFTSRNDHLSSFERFDNDDIKDNIAKMDKLEQRVTKLEKSQKKRGR